MLDQAIKLTADQQQAEDAILNFLAQKPKKRDLPANTNKSSVNWAAHIFLLQGYAGTGKTTLLKNIVNSSPENVVLCAPTHKAVKVLRQKVKADSHIKFETLDSILKSKRVVTPDGSIKFKPTGYKYEPDNYQKWESNLVVVDECSMIQSDKFQNIIWAIKNYKLKFIFVGDDFQINPVNETISPVFRFKSIFQTYELKKIVRQGEDSQIIPLSMFIRNNIDRNFSMFGRFQGEEIEYLDQVHKSKNQYLVDGFFKSDDYINNPDHVKIVSWTNGACDRTNLRIRRLLWGDDCHFIEKNETVIANGPISLYNAAMIPMRIGNGDGYRATIKNNDEFKIINYTQASETFSFTNFTDAFNGYCQENTALMALCAGSWEKFVATREKEVSVFYFKTEVGYGYGNAFIKILNPDKTNEYNKILSAFKSVALKAKAHFKFSSTVNNRIKAQCWKSYYDYDSAYAKFNYNHALTCHKSQGSTYENVFVYGFDILRNKNLQERNRMLYTAVTRASQKLFIIL